MSAPSRREADLIACRSATGYALGRGCRIMTLDVHELSAFYASPLGETTRRLIGRVLRARWENCRGVSLMGLGYCGPYLVRFRDEAVRPLALMPAAQGVSPWPPVGRAASALVVGEMLPLPDACID